MGTTVIENSVKRAGNGRKQSAHNSEHITDGEWVGGWTG